MGIDPTNDPYVLLGRVVTMGDDGVIDDGAVYVQAGTIVTVQLENAPPPAGFDGAEKIRTGGTIYPGLIELHNHLSYNAIPLWEVTRSYLHSGHWRSNNDEYRIHVTKPISVLANTEGNAQALVRFAECRCLLGGVTASQGITLQANGGVKSFYTGFVRNVEHALADDLPGAKARIGEPDSDLDKYVNKLTKAPRCYLQHLSEGINDGVHNTALKQFTGLQRDDHTWAVKPQLCGVHSTALLPEHLEVMRDGGCSIVWSPLSNYLLYGQTTNVKKAHELGVPIALGSDWAPSGTKNLLGELKVAALVSKEEGDVFTAEELCRMVTTTPAQILGWETRLGRVEAGKLADLIVLDDTTGDPFEKLVNARETSVTLVVIGGVPRAGQRGMMDAFDADPTDEVDVGDATRVLNLTVLPGEQELGVTLTEAMEQLDDTLRHLPERAEELDDALVSGWVPGLGLAGSAVDPTFLPAGFREPPFRVILDFEEEEERDHDAYLESLRAGDLADWVEPMQLEALTVADDNEFLKAVLRGVNVPDFIKEGLPEMHGVSLAVPDTARFLDDGSLSYELRQSVELREFLRSEEELTVDERRTIVDQAILLLQDYYVHLPMKRAMHAVDPVQRLRILRHELDGDGATSAGADDERHSRRIAMSFHAEIARAFDSLRDLHTAYRLPRPYAGKVAWLPYMIEECRDDGDGRRFIVSKVIGNAGPKGFCEGLEVLHWNGIPIERYVRRLAERMPSGNDAGRRARAVNSLTMRSLARGQFPDEEWVTLRYRDRDGEIREYEQPWLLFQPRPGRRHLSPASMRGVAACSLGLDDQTDDLQLAKRTMYAPAKARAEDGVDGRAHTASESGEIPTSLPTVFRAFPCELEGTEYGYLRIFTFNVDDADEFVDEMARLLGELPAAGLILDLRGNPGGLITAAESALGLLSPRPVQPEPVQFINTPATIALCRKHSGQDDPAQRRIPDLDLSPWLESMRRSVASGATHSLGFPVTAPEACNARGQVYQGPKVLIVDALCYSAADMFIAGFEDHELGEIIGLDGNTGAGGANVWSHRLLRMLTATRGDPGRFRRLPGGADLRVAIRRTLRVGAHAGELVEDFGVRPTQKYVMTEEDLLRGNRDLTRYAMSRLRQLPVHSLAVTRYGTELRVTAPTADWVTLTVRGLTVDTAGFGGTGRALLRVPPDPFPGSTGAARPADSEIVAYVGDQPVARQRGF